MMEGIMARFKDKIMLCIAHNSAAAALTLVTLNCKQYYIGGKLLHKDIERLGGLLVAAKLYELLMLASL